MRGLALLLLVSCGGERAWCDVADLLDDEADPEAVDCGTAPLDDDASVTACLVDALRAGSAFRGVTQQSTDGGGLVVRAWAGDATGVRILLGTFDLCNASQCSGVVVRRTCGDPTIQTVGEREQIVCGDTSECGEVLCGESEASCP